MKIIITSVGSEKINLPKDVKKDIKRAMTTLLEKRTAMNSFTKLLITGSSRYAVYVDPKEYSPSDAAHDGKITDSIILSRFAKQLSPTTNYLVGTLPEKGIFYVIDIEELCHIQGQDCIWLSKKNKTLFVTKF